MEESNTDCIFQILQCHAQKCRTKNHMTNCIVLKGTRTPLEDCDVHLAGRATCLGFHYSPWVSWVYEQTTKETDNIWRTCLCFVIFSKRLKIIKPYYYFKWLHAISKLKKDLGVKSYAQVVILNPTLMPIRLLNQFSCLWWQR